MTHVERFDRDIGLDQESAASWRARWEAELRDEEHRRSVEAQDALRVFDEAEARVNEPLPIVEPAKWEKAALREIDALYARKEKE